MKLNPFSSTSELPRAWRIIFATIITILLGSLVLALFQLRKGASQSNKLWASYERNISVYGIVSKLVDAETGQRGYILTGNSEFLLPFNSAIDDLDEALLKLKEKYSEEDDLMKSIEALVSQEKNELKEPIDLYRQGDRLGAIQKVASGDAKRTMDKIREIAATLKEHEQLLVSEYRGEVLSIRKSLVFLICLSVVLTPLFILSTLIIRRHLLNRRELLRKEMDARMVLERELIKSEMISTSVLNNSGDCIKIVEADGTLSFMNDPGIELMELNSFADLQGTSWPSLWGEFELLAQKAITDALQTGIGRFQGVCKTAKGRAKWWDVIITPMKNSEVGGARLITISRDITEIRNYQRSIERSEANFKALTETVPQLLWRSNSYGEVDYFNEQWFEYTGMTRPAKDLSTEERLAAFRECVTFVHPEDFSPVKQKWQECCKSGLLYEAEYRLRSKTGEYNWFITKALPVTDADGKIIHWFGSCSNINLQKISQLDKEQLLAAERAARADAERATHLKDEFLASVSHELRTPLNAILGWTQILKKNRTNAETIDRGLDVIDKNGRIQAQLIEDLLDMSRILSGKLRIDVAAVDVGEVADAVVAMVEPTIQAKSITLKKEIESGATINGDSSRINQIVWNLLSNAVKFTPKNGEISVSIKRIGSQVELRISDTGIGMAPEFLPFVFQRFAQADGSSTKKHGGLGLGLSIVNSLVEMHGGTATAASDGENRGSTFTITFPVATVSLFDRFFSSSLFENKKEYLPTAVKSVLKNISVLVLDDEEDNREVVQRILEDYGVTVISLPTVDNALAYLKETAQKPDLILSDIGMPERDGYDFIKELRNTPGDISTIPAAALTALARESDKERVLASGFQRHIAKPIQPNELLATIASMARREGTKPKRGTKEPIQ